MNDISFGQDDLPFSQEQEIDRLCSQFETAWRAGQHPRIEDYLEKVASPLRDLLLKELIATEADLRREAGEDVRVEQYHQRFPGHREVVEAAWALLAELAPADDDPVSTVNQSQAPDFDTSSNEVEEGQGEPQPVPSSIGRYEIRKVLGEGGFGRVYLAFDTDLGRQVALKVPGRKRLSSASSVEAFLHEARTAAQLKHPGLVVVYDVQRDGDDVYIVQEYIDGQDLAQWVRSTNPTVEQIVSLLAEVVEAIGFAHQHDLVHRDLKPANLLLDQEGHPHVADFGLAVNESVQRLRKGEVCGTPAYMSPEQVRGESHLLDGRSDLWSIGVILYELLTGRRPFRGNNMAEVFEDVKRRDPKPPRQIRPAISGELERICLKCLQKQQTGRYASAAELLEDLQAWMHRSDEVGPPGVQPVGPARVGEQAAGSTAVAEDTESDEQTAPRIVPKGLRSFDEHDADFFLELLPGARDRHGLPESIRFWKQRIEETDFEKTFRVGLIYGPSGCGKSSLVKAGLLPRLASHIVPVYLEAAPEDTELRLLKGLRRRFSAVPEDLSLPEALAGIREGLWVPDNTKVCVVLDQFEQWLHARRGEQDTQLVQALRHCDGSRLQSITLVRDDFWLAASRFMKDLDIRLVEAENSVLVDLFDPLHARKVLAAFGRAYGRLPDGTAPLSDEQQHFLDRAVAGLAQDGKIICVRLALFADMLQGKPWTTATLKDVGGTEGLGVTFLEETFSVPTAPAAHRHHQQAVQSVLKALLPESGSDIKGSRQSYEQLLDASGYTQHRERFGELIQILDGEIRLITPTVPQGADADDRELAESPQSPDTTEETDDQRDQYYQLTHDYLVPSLRDWLTRRKKETRRGRAQLRLAERSALWNAKPEPRHLPSLWEYGTIRLLTDDHQWTEQQRTMMAKATRVHGVRSFMATLLALLTIIIGYGTYGWIQGGAAVKTLLNADALSVGDAAERVASYRFWTTDDLKEVVESDPATRADRRRQLHARLALLHFDAEQIEPLLNELLTTEDTAYVGVIRQALLDANAPIAEECWSLLHNPDKPDAQRFRAGVVLVGLEPQSDLWATEDFQLLVDQLVAINAVYQPDFWPLLENVGNRMLSPLEEVFHDRERPESEQVAAANAIARFAQQDTRRLARLLLTASGPQYRILYDTYKETADKASNKPFLSLVRQQPAEDLGLKQRIILGKERAASAITLLRQGEQDVIMDVLRYETDPEALTQFVHRCRARGVTHQELIGCLEEVDRRRGPLDGQRQKVDDSVMYALLLSLGEFAWDELPAQRDALVKRLGDIYEKDPSSGVHSATSWLLRKWGQSELVAGVDQRELPYDESGRREWYVQKIRYRASGIGRLLGQQKEFYLTFIVFSPDSFIMGSPEDEPNHQSDEARHRVTLTRPIAVCDRELTWAQWMAMEGGGRRDAYARKFSKPLGDGDPVFVVEWFDAVTYCRWLTERVGLSEEDQCYEDPTLLPKDGDGNPASWPLLLDKSGFRLLTEAEWEYVCRSGTSSSYSFGGDEEQLDHYAWYLKNSGDWSHAVADLRPNPRGLFDIHGNVFEWCHDWSNDELTELREATDPLAEEGRYRVYRGGSWRSSAGYCRSSYRLRSVPPLRIFHLGFRVATVPPSPRAGGSAAASGSR